MCPRYDGTKRRQPKSWWRVDGSYFLQSDDGRRRADVLECSSRLLANRNVLDPPVIGVGRLSCYRHCLASPDCDAAVFLELSDGSTSCTKLSEVSSGGSLDGFQQTAVDVSKARQCELIQVNPCLNSGQRLDGICVCDATYTGELCELVNPSYCNAAWTSVYSIIMGTNGAPPTETITKVLPGQDMFRAKMKFRDTKLGVDRVMTSSMLRMNASGIVAGASRETLEKDSWRTISSTARRQFVYLNGDGTFEVLNLNLNGLLYQIAPFTGSLEVMAREPSYQKKLAGSVASYDQMKQDLEDGCDIFEQTTVSVYNKPLITLELTHRYLLSDNLGKLLTPPAMGNFKFFLGDTYDRAAAVMGKGYINAVYTYPAVSEYDVNTCWIPVNSTGQRSIKKLGAYLRRGHEVRVYLNETFYKVLEVTETLQEFTFILAPKMSKNGTDRLDLSTYGVKSLVTSGGYSQTCTHVMEGETIKNTTDGVSSNVRWYIDTRGWSPVYSVYSNSSVAFGSVQVLIQGIRSGQDVRVWIQWMLDGKSRFMDTQSSSITDDGKVSTESVVTWATTFTSSSSTRLSPACGYEYVLVTSEGYVEVATFNIVTPVKKMVQDNVKVTWFLN